MSKTAIGGILIALGLVMLALLAVGLRLPSGVKLTAYFLFVVIPIAIGAAYFWAGWRGSAARTGAEAKHLAIIKDQIAWRALAKGGQITVAEAADEAKLEPTIVERALMSLVAEGRAAVEPRDAGDVVYRIESAVSAPHDEVDA